MKIAIVAMTLLVAVAAGCGSSNPGSSSPPQSASPITVETVTVKSRTLDTMVSLPGQLLPYESVDVYPKVTGFLESIRVDVGSRVHKGDVLIRLSAPELLAQRAQAESALHAAESQLASAQAKLASDQGTYTHLAAAAQTPGVVAANDLMVAGQMATSDKGVAAAAESNVSAAREALRSVTQMESYLSISAPFDGMVTARNLHPGALTGPASGQAGSMPIIRIVDANRLRLVVPLPEAEAEGTKRGQQVAFTVPAYPGQTFHAPISLSADAVDPNTRTMHIELDVKNVDGKLSPGSYATVSWPVQRSYPTMFVPASSVTSDQQHTFVVRVRDGKAEWVTVQTGQTVNGEVEVFGDIHPGDQVVRMASDSIRSGQAVNTQSSKQS